MSYYEYISCKSAEENIAMALLGIANELRRIGLNNSIDTSAPGALEALAMNVESGFSTVGSAIESLAEAVSSMGDSVKD